MKNSLGTHARKVVVASSVAVFCAAGSFTAGAVMADPQKNTTPAVVYPTTAEGLTYGKPSKVLSEDSTYNPRDLPDLVSVISEEGKQGWAEAKYLFFTEDDATLTPEEALAAQATASDFYIPVYDLEGNVIGRFKIQAQGLTPEQPSDPSYSAR